MAHKADAFIGKMLTAHPYLLPAIMLLVAAFITPQIPFLLPILKLFGFGPLGIIKGKSTGRCASASPLTSSRIPRCPCTELLLWTDYRCRELVFPTSETRDEGWWILTHLDYSL